MGLSKKLAKYGMVRLSKLMSLAGLIRLAGRDLYVINYHSIAGVDVDPYINDNTYRSASEFEEDIRFYTGHFNILSPVDLLDLIADNKPLPENSLVITFDDGLRINYDIQTPILKKYNVKATFFLCSAFVDNKDLHYGRKINLLKQKIIEKNDLNLDRAVRDYLINHNIYDIDNYWSLGRISYGKRRHLDEIARMIPIDFDAYLSEAKPYLDSAQIRDMLNEGFTIGAHSIDHPNYSELNLEEQLRQTIESTEYVTRNFGLNYKLFAFPYNDGDLTSEFFERISQHVDLTFGMGGFVDDPARFNIQRGEIESTRLPVELAFKYRLLLSYLCRILKIKRVT